MKQIAKIGLLIILISCQVKENKNDFSEQADLFFSSQFSTDGPGGAIFIMKDTSVLFSKARGLANLKTKEPITTKTLFNIGSISKTFVANGILLLQEQGRLSAEDSIWKYFPGFKNKSIAQRVKIKHLLTHTSGLPDNRPIQKDSVFYLTANDEQNWFPITQTDTLEFEPGTKYNYSNPAYNALALIIEQVSGTPWREFIRDKIFIPSGMTHSTITDGAHPDFGVSHGYAKITGVWTEDDYGEEPTFCAAGNGGVWTSVEELARYEQAIQKATFLKPETIRDSRSIKTFPNWKSSAPANRGWSWQIVKTREGFFTAEHTGHQGGFAANYISIPEKGILLLVIYNAPYDVYLFRERMMELLKKSGYLN